MLTKIDAFKQTCHAGFVSSSLFSTDNCFLVTKVSVHWQ